MSNIETIEEFDNYLTDIDSDVLTKDYDEADADIRELEQQESDNCDIQFE